MHRAISNYKITKRKDGRYYVRLQDGGGITLSIKEANKLTGIGINSIEDRLREPNCPFVLFVGVKKMIKRKEFEEYPSKALFFQISKKVKQR